MPGRNFASSCSTVMPTYGRRRAALDPRTCRPRSRPVRHVRDTRGGIVHGALLRGRLLISVRRARPCAPCGRCGSAPVRKGVDPSSSPLIVRHASGIARVNGAPVALRPRSSNRWLLFRKSTADVRGPPRKWSGARRELPTLSVDTHVTRCAETGAAREPGYRAAAIYH